MVSRVSMLSICTARECTTIVFGRGTCVEHDERYQLGTDGLPTEAVTSPGQTEETVATLSRIT